MAGSLHLSAGVCALIACFCFVNGAVLKRPKVSITPPRVLAGHLGDDLSVQCAADAADAVSAGARLCLYTLEGTGQQRRLSCVTGAPKLQHYLALSARDHGRFARCVLQQVNSSRTLTTLDESHNVPIVVYYPADQVRFSPANISIVTAEPGDYVRFDCAALATPYWPEAKFAHLLVIRPGTPTYLRREYSKAFQVSKSDDSAEVTCACGAEGALRSRPVRLVVRPAAAPALQLAQYQSAPNLTLSRNKKVTNEELSSESSSDEDSDEAPPRAPTVGFGDVYEYKCRADSLIENSRLCLYQLDKGQDKKTEKLTCEHNAKQLVKKLFLTNSERDSRVLCVSQVFDSARQAFLTIAKSGSFNITFTRQSIARVHMQPEGAVTAAAGDRVRLACHATGLPRRARLAWLESGGSGDRPRIEKVDSGHAQELHAVRAHDAGVTLRCVARDWDSAARRPADLARSHPLALTVIDDGLKGMDNERAEVYVSPGVRNVTVATRGRVTLACRAARRPPAGCLAWLQTRRDQSRVVLSAACGISATEVRVTLAATGADAGSALHCAVLRDMVDLQEIARSDAIPIIVQ